MQMQIPAFFWSCLVMRDQSMFVNNQRFPSEPLQLTSCRLLRRRGVPPAAVYMAGLVPPG